MDPLVIIGGDAAGMSAASAARRLDRNIPISVFEKGKYVSYSACGIPYYISKDVPELNQLIKYKPEFFKTKRNIDVFTNQEVVSVYPSKRAVRVKNLVTGEEREILYSKLIIATGARPFCPPSLDIDAEGIFKIRSIDDAKRIRSFIEQVQPATAVVVGSGYIGMEMVEALLNWGIHVKVVEMMPEILLGFDSEIKQIVVEKLKEKGVEIYTSTAVDRIVPGNNNEFLVISKEGKKIKGNMVILGMGVVPNTELAQEAGIAVGYKKAIVVDRFLRTSHPLIFAAGDCAETYHNLLNRNVYIPMGTTANRQGRIAGANAMGQSVPFSGVMGTAVFKLFSLQIGVTGLTEQSAQKEGFEIVHTTIKHVTASGYHPFAAPIHVKLIAEKRSGRVLGAQIIGEKDVAKRIDVIATALSAKMTIRDLLDIDYTYAPPISPPQEPIWIAANQLNKLL